MELTCINPYFESLHYALNLLFCCNHTLILLMEQSLVNFSKEVNLKGVKAWDITLRNISVIHRMYGVTNAQRRRGVMHYRYMLH